MGLASLVDNQGFRVKGLTRARVDCSWGGREKK